MDNVTDFDRRYAEADLRLKYAVKALQQAHGGGQQEAEQVAALPSCADLWYHRANPTGPFA